MKLNVERRQSGVLGWWRSRGTSDVPQPGIMVKIQVKIVLQILCGKKALANEVGDLTVELSTIDGFSGAVNHHHTCFCVSNTNRVVIQFFF